MTLLLELSFSSLLGLEPDDSLVANHSVKTETHPGIADWSLQRQLNNHLRESFVRDLANGFYFEGVDRPLRAFHLGRPCRKVLARNPLDIRGQESYAGALIRTEVVFRRQGEGIPFEGN